jgi:adenylate cyclase
VSTIYRFGHIEVRVSERALRIDGKPVALGARAFDMLLALILHRERVVGRDELLEAVWPGLEVEENNLRVQVVTLRKLLGPQAIATIPGRGYQFCMSDAAVANDGGRGVRSSPKPVLIASLAAVLVLGAAGVYWNTWTNAKAPTQGPQPGKVEAGAGPLSLAVLPFANLTGDPSQAYLADGLTASLTTDLSRIRDAYVVNAATALAYKDKPITAQQVGLDLGVHFLLQGSVQRNGGRIRIDAQLADTLSNAQLWSDSFEGDVADLFVLQDQVTTRIGNSIGREMVIASAREGEAHDRSPQAVDLMLRASALNLKPFSLPKFRETEALYRQALALEPGNSGAMAGLANSLVTQADRYGYELDDRVKQEKFAEGLGYALKARQLDPGNPAAYVALMVHAISHDDYAGALRAAESRLRLDPRNPVAYNNLALIRLQGGEAQTAIELETQGISLDPKSPRDGFFLTLGRAYFMLGDYDAAIEWSLKSLERNPAYASAFTVLAMAYALKKDGKRARAAVAELRRLEPDFRLTASQRPGASTPAAYRQYWENKYLPAWRLAGLPE